MTISNKAYAIDYRNEIGLTEDEAMAQARAYHDRTGKEVLVFSMRYDSRLNEPHRFDWCASENWYEMGISDQRIIWCSVDEEY